MQLIYRLTDPLSYPYSLCCLWIPFTFEPRCIGDGDGDLVYGLQLYCWLHLCPLVQDEWW